MEWAIRERAVKAEAQYLGRKVLLVDENVQDLSNHAKLLESEGFEVVKCGSYETAMCSVEKEDFDFAMVDQGSPAFEGRGVLRYLNQVNPRTPFVVSTRCAK
jgi:DNA-binding NtrC family response regulator